MMTVPRKILSALAIASLGLMVCISVRAFAETAPTIKTTISVLSGSGSSSTRPPRALYLLVLGSDSRGELNGRSDTIILCYVDFVTSRTALVSIPRDTRAAVPGRGMTKINSALAYGGPELAVETVRELSGLPVYYYIETTFKGFKRIVNSLGGVRFTLPKPIFDEWAEARLPAGTRVLSGEEALALVRSRHVGHGDFDRMKRQRQFLIAVLTQEKAREADLTLEYLRSIKNNCRTNVTPEIAEILIKHAKGLDPDKIFLQTIPGTERSGRGGYYIILDSKKSKAIFERLKPVAKGRLEALLRY